jgi:hypothetical protein
MNYVEPHEFKKEFEYELGETVRVKCSYKEVMVKARGKFETIFGVVEETYAVFDGERTMILTNHELEKKK